MKICRTKAELREIRTGMAGRVGLVPTMGALHDGHLALVEAARADCDHVVATIFVNPSQFGPNEDLASYPRDPARDLRLFEAGGVDAVFLPEPDEMYHPGAQTIVETTRLSRILIGRLRPGHFRGVATVVTKLFNLVQPDTAYFGQKDYQQLQVIRTMVRDLDMPVRIEGLPTRRDADGLALSSRNRRLTPAQRAAAPALHAALREADDLAARGWSAARIASWVRDTLAGVEGARVDSVDLRDAETLAPVRGALDRPTVVLLAVRFGDVLLIDNRVISPEGPAP